LQDAPCIVTELVTAIDTDKDQTYFLSQVSQEVLSRVIFPIGGYHKSRVRELATEYDLHTASKKDSQGICFIGREMDVKGFLKRYIPEELGNVLNTGGEVIGTHNGVKIITIGERIGQKHGFTINPAYKTTEMSRLFVISREIDKNTVTVGTKAELNKAEQEGTGSVLINGTNWINEPPKLGMEYKCRIRHRGELYRCKLVPTANPTWDLLSTDSGARIDGGGVEVEAYKIEFAAVPYAPAPGQFVAVYDGEVCLGAGVLT
jgi:tRNA-specific 2-thiouridylase